MSTLCVLVYQSTSILRSSAPGGLLKHLLECKLQPADIRLRAETDQKQKCQGNSPAQSQMSLGYQGASLPDINILPPLTALPQFGLPETVQNSCRFHPYLNAQFESPAVHSGFPPSSSPTLNRCLSYDQEGSSLLQTSSNDSFAPLDSASVVLRTGGDQVPKKSQALTI